jgi:hypothetical protein
MRLSLAQVSGLESDVVGGFPSWPEAYRRHIENQIRSGNTTLALLGSVRSTRSTEGDVRAYPNVRRVGAGGRRAHRGTGRGGRRAASGSSGPAGSSARRSARALCRPARTPAARQARTSARSPARSPAGRGRSGWRRRHDRDGARTAAPCRGRSVAGEGGVRLVPGSIPGRAGRLLLACPCVAGPHRPLARSVVPGTVASGYSRMSAKAIRKAKPARRGVQSDRQASAMVTSKSSECANPLDE